MDIVETFFLTNKVSTKLYFKIQPRNSDLKKRSSSSSNQEKVSDISLSEDGNPRESFVNREANTMEQ